MSTVQLESGPARGELAWYFGWTIACIAFAGYFYYDGAIGYLQKNRDAAESTLVPLLGKENIPETLGSRPTEADFTALLEADETSAVKARELLGGREPTHTESEPPLLIEYYASDYGMVTLPIHGDLIDPERMNKESWTSWAKSKDEIESQFYFALLPLALGLYMLARAIKAASLRIRLDDDTLRHGAERIALSSIVSLRDYNPKGWVDLYHIKDDKEARLRLDNQRIAKFDELIDALCAIKGYSDPRVATADAPAETESPDASRSDVEADASDK